MKYEITKIKHHSREDLRRIRALKDIPMYNVKTGDLGGYVQGARNLSQGYDCWISGDAHVAGSARVTGSAIVADSAIVAGSARVSGLARVADSAYVAGSALVTDSAIVAGSAIVTELAIVTDSAIVAGSARVSGLARVADSAYVAGLARVTCSARVTGSAHVTGEYIYALGLISYYTAALSIINGNYTIEAGCTKIILGDNWIEEFDKEFKDHKDYRIFLQQAKNVEALAKQIIDGLYNES